MKAPRRATSNRPYHPLKLCKTVMSVDDGVRGPLVAHVEKNKISSILEIVRRNLTDILVTVGSVTEEG